MIRVESLLSARLFMSPERVGDRVFFISNISGQMSLYAMDYGGSVPEPLLPPNIALQNPELVSGKSFKVLPKLEKILVMIDNDGDENYQPMLIPIAGGFPEPAFGDRFLKYRVHAGNVDPDRNIIYLIAESREHPINEVCQANLETGEVALMAEGAYLGSVGGENKEHTFAALLDSYTFGDTVIYLWRKGVEGRQTFFGKPLEERAAGESVPLNGISSMELSPSEKGLLVVNAVHDDAYGIGYLDLAGPGIMEPVEILGSVHRGSGELKSLRAAKGDRYSVEYNIDGVSWLYEGVFDEANLRMQLEYVICGQDPLAQGVKQEYSYDKETDSYTLAFSSATSPVQLYTVEGAERETLVMHTNERVLGVPKEWLSPGEDASFESFDGLRVSARLYRPAKDLGFEGPRPLVYYVHGGPQSQEKPDFTWFSMPLIQFLTMSGYAVFVPNARGSTGYGLSYTKHVDRDWGGDDRLDHVHAMQVLADDPLVDTERAGVVGRSYGGYMTLTLAGRHPDLWSAAIDMFGPYDLITFSERIPETWKPHFKVAIGDPDDPQDRAILIERSPKTHLHQLSCPMLVIQGKNDPRVVEKESHDLVEALRAQGKEIDYLMFENEGHDVLKYENRVRCYNAIKEFFDKTLQP